ncbi:MAG: BamA/TamA family outer membrane protein [candidate division Zixibacteria bacterium]
MKIENLNLPEEVSWLRYSNFILYISACICLCMNISANQFAVEYTGDMPDTFVKTGIEKIIANIKRDRATDTLGEFLISSGYLNNQISINDSTITIIAGPVYYVDLINLEIIKSDGEKISKQINQLTDVIASRENIESIKSEILDEYQDEGYFFASLNVVGVTHYNNSLELNLRLITGPPVNLERVRFKGLSKTSPDFVEKLSGLKAGDALIFSNIESAAEKISNSGFLSIDTIPSVIPNQNYDGVELTFILSELKSNQIEFAGGYLPGRGDRDGEFVGYLNFKSKNIFGGGRRIDLLLDRKDRLSSRIEFGYLQPVFTPDLLEISGRFRQIDNGDFYHLFSIEGALTIQIRKHTKLSGAISWTKTEAQNMLQAPSRAWTGEFSYQYSNLDDALNPSKGSSLGGSISYIRRVSWPDTVATGVINNDSKVSISADNFIPLTNHIVFRLNFENRIYITSRDLIDFSEQFKLGGYGSLRGYRQEQFAGRRVALGQAELRYRPSTAASLYIFSDIGYIYSLKLSPGSDLINEELLKPGFGAGIFAAKSNTSVTLEAGWGENDNLGQGKLHFGLRTKF